MILTLNLGRLAPEVCPGDSVAVDGTCLTATKRHGELVEFDVSSETVRLTTLGELKSNSRVNVELALRAGDRLGGHFVSGHIDGTGVIREKKELPGEWRVKIAVPRALAARMVQKGSVAVDGISLTVAALEQDSFEVNLIPHTLAATTMQHKGPGDRVNIECDMIGKYVRKLLGSEPPPDGPLSVERLRREGF